MHSESEWWCMTRNPNILLALARQGYSHRTIAEIAGVTPDGLRSLIGSSSSGTACPPRQNDRRTCERRVSFGETPSHPANGPSSGNSRLFRSTGTLRQYSETGAPQPCGASRTTLEAPPEANATCEKACRSEGTWLRCLVSFLQTETWQNTPLATQLWRAPSRARVSGFREPLSEIPAVCVEARAQESAARTPSTLLEVQDSRRRRGFSRKLCTAPTIIPLSSINGAMFTMTTMYVPSDR